MKKIYGFVMSLFIAATPAFADYQKSTEDIIFKMKTALDLQEDQITNITPIIEKYSTEFHDLKKSINEGTINSSAIDSQWQGIEDAETQELSPYLKPYQLSEWKDLQDKLYQQKDDGDSGSDEYSNLPEK